MNRTNGKIAEQTKPKIMEAELSRKTFYRLFPDKEAVLKLYFEGLFTECLTQIKAQDIHHYI